MDGFNLSIILNLKRRIILVCIMTFISVVSFQNFAFINSPSIEKMGLGCNFNECIWISGNGFGNNCEVKLFSGDWSHGEIPESVITSSSKNGLNCSDKLVTFEIPISIRFKFRSLNIVVVNTQNKLWTDPVLIYVPRRIQNRLAEQTVLRSDLNVLTQKIILSLPISLSETKKLFFHSDGRFFPGGKALASVQLALDGVYIGNSSQIDWTTSIAPAQHSFDLIATENVAPGNHTLELIAINTKGANGFWIGAGTNIKILESSAHSIYSRKLNTDSADLTNPNPSTTDNPTLTSLLNMDSEVFFGPSVFLASGRVSYKGKFINTSNPADPKNQMGDGMMGISLNGNQCPLTSQASWSVNDLWVGAEFQAPVFSQAFWRGEGSIRPHLNAGAFPWDKPIRPDPVKFCLGSTTTFLGLNFPAIAGGIYLTSDGKTPSCNVIDYICVGSTSKDYSSEMTSLGNSWPHGVIATWPGCPEISTHKIIAEGDILIPADHDGVVALFAKTRVQADETDEGGNVFLGINVDGVQKGFIGVQEIKKGQGASQRTVGASFLSNGTGKLIPGLHHIQIWMMAIGSFKHVTAVRDLPFVYFD